MAVIQGQNSVVVGWRPADRGADHEDINARAALCSAKDARKTKARLDRAKLVIVKARARAAVTAQRYAAQPSTMRPMRPPTVLQRQRLAERLNAKP